MTPRGKTVCKVAISHDNCQEDNVDAISDSDKRNLISKHMG